MTLSTLNSLAYVLLNEGKPQAAREFLDRGLELSESHGFTLVRSDLLSNLAEYYAQLNLREQAIETFETSLKLCRSLGKTQMEPSQVAEIMLMYLSAGRTEKMRATLDELVPLLDRAQFWWQPQQAYWVLACAYRELGDQEQSKIALQRASDILIDRIRKIQDKQSRASYLTIAFNSAIVAASKRGRWPELRGNL